MLPISRLNIDSAAEHEHIQDHAFGELLAVSRYLESYHYTGIVYWLIYLTVLLNFKPKQGQI